jgi:hypothetical protein
MLLSVIPVDDEHNETVLSDANGTMRCDCLRVVDCDERSKHQFYAAFAFRLQTEERTGHGGQSACSGCTGRWMVVLLLVVPL